MGNGDIDVSTETVRRWLPTLVVAFGLAVSWGTMQTQLDVLADEVKELNNEDTEHNRRERAVDKEVAALKANQEAIKEDVGEIKERQKEQDKKLDKILEELRNND